MAKVILDCDVRNGSYIDNANGNLYTPTAALDLIRTSKGYASYKPATNVGIYDGLSVSSTVTLFDEDRTVEVWYKGNNLANLGLEGVYRVAIGSGTNGVVLVYAGVNYTYCIASGGFVRWNNTYSIDGKWHHYMFECPGNDLDNYKLYVDGVEQTVNTVVGTTMDTVTVDKLFGNYYNSSTIKDLGVYYSKVRVYDGIISPQEREIAYNEYLHSYPTIKETNPRLNLNEYKPTDLSKEVDSRVGIPEADTSSLLDSGKGAFATDTEDWTPYSNNIVERVSDVDAENGYAIKITYVDGIGAYNYFREAELTTEDLTIGKKYFAKVRAKINNGSASINITGATSATLDATNYTWYYFVFTCTVINTVFSITAMGGSEIVHIDQYEIQEWDGEELVPDEDYGYVFNNASNWTPQGNNTVEQDGDYVKIIYVDNATGALMQLDSANGTTYETDLITDSKYRIVFEAKVNTPGCSVVIIDDSGVVLTETVNNTSYQTFVSDWTVGDIDTYIRLGSFSAGEIIWIRILSIKKITGLVAAYNMIPNGDTLVDISGNGKNISIVSEKGLASTATGLKFDGVPKQGDLQVGTFTYISVNKPNTIVIRGKFVSGNILTNYITSSDRISINGSSTNWSCRYWNGSGYVGLRYTTDINPNMYCTLVYAFDGSSIAKLWIDGIEETTTTGGSSNLPSGGDLRIGSRGGSDAWFTGEIVDIKFFNYMWTEQQAIDYHNSFVKPVLVEDFSSYAVGQTI